MKLTILGTSAAVPTVKRGLTSQVLTVENRSYLIDCGEGTQLQMQRFGVARGKIRQIFISHLHGDHVFGLPGLLTSFALNGRKEPLDLFGPIGISRYIISILEATTAFLTYQLTIYEHETTDSKIIFRDHLLEVSTIPLVHRVPCAGFLFQENPKQRHIIPEKIVEFQIPFHKINGIKNGANFVAENGQVIDNQALTLEPSVSKSFAFVSDTSFSEAIIPQISGVNLLYHEATFLTEHEKEAILTGHSTAAQAAEIANRANVEKLVIGHFSARYSDLLPNLLEAQNVFNQTILGEDGLEILI
jgi:ribonuclease Z